jgi:hypothetical protein
MEPPDDGLVQAAEAVGPGGGVLGAVGDLPEGQETFAGAGVFRVEGQTPQIIERSSPVLDLDTDHRQPFSGGMDHPKLLSFLKITRQSHLGNSWSSEDLGLSDIDNFWVVIYRNSSVERDVFLQD